jgi:hypothetical protein
MKKSIVLILISLIFATAESFSQSPILSGRMLYNAPVYFEKGMRTPAKLLKNTVIEIVNADNNYFTIIYENGIAFVLRNDVKCISKDLKQFESDIAELKASGKFDNTFGFIKTKQIIDGISAGNSSSVLDLKKLEDPLKFEIDHIRHCANRYNREIMTGYTFTILGSVVSGVGAFTDEPKIPIAAGAALSLIGTVLIIDSQKWMKQIYIGPNGVGVRYKF